MRCVFVEAHDEVRNKNGEGGRECCHTTGSGWKKEVVVVVIWGDDEEDDNRPDRYPGLILPLSEECVCHEVVHVVVAVGHYAVLFCAVQR